MVVATQTLAVNVGCGEFPLDGWLNCDEIGYEGVDLICHIPPMPFESGSVDDLYAGHMLEHLNQRDAGLFLEEAMRVLRPGGRLGVLVPDTREILRRWLLQTGDVVECPQGTFWQMNDLDDVCGMFIYSTYQPSRHLWSYDASTLRRLIERHGFEVTGPIDRQRDPRIFVGAWWQMGFNAVKPC